MRGALRFVPLALLLFGSQACVVTEDGLITEPLVVQWSIDGVEDPDLCDVYGIDIWEVDVGPGGINTDVDCRNDPWEQEFELEAGSTYTVRVGAYDSLAEQLIVDETDIIDVDELDAVDLNESFIQFFDSDF